MLRRKVLNVKAIKFEGKVANYYRGIGQTYAEQVGKQMLRKRATRC
jgi:hypothetical protein